MNELKKYSLKSMGLVKTLKDLEKQEALSLIDKGADVHLIYFWYNLAKGFFQNFKLEDVHKQAVYYIGKYPDFEKDIIQWLTAYERRVKELESEEVTQGA